MSQDILPRQRELLRILLNAVQISFLVDIPNINLFNGTPLQYSCLENPRDGGAWWAAVYGATQSRTRLTDLAAAAAFPEMLLLAATHCSTCTTTYGGSVIPHHFSVEPSLHQLIGKGEKSRSPFMLRAVLAELMQVCPQRVKLASTPLRKSPTDFFSY